MKTTKTRRVIRPIGHIQSFNNEKNFYERLTRRRTEVTIMRNDHTPTVRVKVKKPVAEGKDIPVTVRDFSHYNEFNHMIYFPTPTGYERNVFIYKYPTDNCQLASMGRAENLMMIDLKYLNLFFKELFNMGFNQVLLDVIDTKASVIKGVLNKAMTVVMEQEYLSTNGTLMRLIIYKWNFYEIEKIVKKC